MEVTKYISQLLHHHECVILPDFGGFVTNCHSARIDFHNNSFYPPRKDITFNRQLTQNDGLLINYLSQVEGIEYLESKKLVVGFVKSSFEKLKLGNRLVFDGIGSFYFDENKLLQFEPDLSANYLLDSYGLSSFHFPAIADNPKVEKRKEIAFTDRKPALSDRKRVLRRILIAAPFVLMIGFFPIRNQIVSTQPKSEQVSLDPIRLFIGDSSPSIATIESSTPKLTNVEKHDLDSKSDDLKTEETKRIELDLVAPIETSRFYIIAGSCRSQQEAGIFADKIAQKGYNPILLEPNEGRFRIALAGFHTKDKAHAELTSYRKNEFPTAWVWTKE